MKIIEAINYLLGNFLNNKKAYLNFSLNYLDRRRVIDRNYMDYIRLSALELVAHEINTNKIEGAVAELGVYKGKFARHINAYFPNRKLYLFDTFQGFSQNDIKSELKNTYSSGAQDFSDTSIKKVLEIMPLPDMCIIKEGYFPATTAGINEDFAFVSIDADLFDPIYCGLQYFYPRLKKGGYIFVHDYNNDAYKGARKAVEKYCHENGLSKLPLPDSGGTAVLLK